MDPTTHVNFIWFRMGQSLPDVKPAPELYDDMADLTAYFRDLLRTNPEAFNCTAELQGFAPMRLSFRAPCQTVALVIRHPHTARDEVLDAVCLLVNGLEGPADIAAVKSHVQYPPELWRMMDRPVEETRGLRGVQR